MSTRQKWFASMLRSFSQVVRYISILKRLDVPFNMRFCIYFLILKFALFSKKTKNVYCSKKFCTH